MLMMVVEVEYNPLPNVSYAGGMETLQYCSHTSNAWYLMAIMNVVVVVVSSNTCEGTYFSTCCSVNCYEWFYSSTLYFETFIGSNIDTTLIFTLNPTRFQIYNLVHFSVS
jgi:hypothetical protein